MISIETGSLFLDQYFQVGMSWILQRYPQCLSIVLCPVFDLLDEIGNIPQASFLNFDLYDEPYIDLPLSPVMTEVTVNTPCSMSTSVRIEMLDETICYYMLSTVCLTSYASNLYQRRLHRPLSKTHILRIISLMQLNKDGKRRQNAILLFLNVTETENGFLENTRKTKPLECSYFTCML